MQSGYKNFLVCQCKNLRSCKKLFDCYVLAMEANWFQRLEGEIKRACDAGASLRGLSLAIGQNENYLTQMLKRGNAPTVDKFLALCEVLEVSPTYILYGVQQSPRVQRFVEIASSYPPEQQDDLVRFLESARIAPTSPKPDQGQAHKKVQ
jgi:hypothetical protein